MFEAGLGPLYRSSDKGVTTRLRSGAPDLTKSAQTILTSTVAVAIASQVTSRHVTRQTWHEQTLVVGQPMTSFRSASFPRTRDAVNMFQCLSRQFSSSLTITQLSRLDHLANYKFFFILSFNFIIFVLNSFSATTADAYKLEEV